jgi:nitric oxide reductase NorQ protein
VTAAAVAQDASGGIPMALCVRPRPDFVDTPYISEITDKVTSYLEADIPVHLRGAAGTGKTTLALHCAGKLGRPVMLIAGDEEFGTRDLIGGEHGYHYRKVVDRFVHTVLKYEEDAVQQWVDQRLTTACREGWTLVYDEFNRSRPEANNVLLGILAERLLILPAGDRKNGYMKVNPQFRAIFTSNHRDYVGVHQVQDALSDRMLTLDLDYYDRDTEIAITCARSGMSAEDASGIVDVVRDFRESGECEDTPTLRSSFMIGRIAAMKEIRPLARDPRFMTICLDVLGAKAGLEKEQRDQRRQMLVGLIERYCQ